MKQHQTHHTPIKDKCQEYASIFHPCACGCGEIIQKHKFQNGYLLAEIRYFQVGHHKRGGPGTRKAFGEDKPWQPWILDYSEPTQCGKCGAGRANIIYERETWQDASWHVPCSHWRCMLCGWRKMIKQQLNEQETSEITAHETNPSR